MYAFEFVADDATVITFPVEVDETGELGGAWAGTTDTPLGPIPLELEVIAAQHTVTVTVMGAAGTDTGAETRQGWIRAQFALDIVGLGPLTAFARLGLVDTRLEGLLYVRTDTGELCFPTALTRV